MYGIKVLFDEVLKDWVWLIDSTSSFNTELNILSFETYDEALEYSKNIRVMRTKVEKIS